MVHAPKSWWLIGRDQSEIFTLFQLICKMRKNDLMSFHSQINHATWSKKGLKYYAIIKLVLRNNEVNKIIKLLLRNSYHYVIRTYPGTLNRSLYSIPDSKNRSSINIQKLKQFRNVKMYEKLKAEITKLSIFFDSTNQSQLPAIKLKTFKSMDELKLTYRCKITEIM